MVLTYMAVARAVSRLLSVATKTLLMSQEQLARNLSESESAICVGLGIGAGSSP